MPRKTRSSPKAIADDAMTINAAAAIRSMRASPYFSFCRARKRVTRAARRRNGESISPLFLCGRRVGSRSTLLRRLDHGTALAEANAGKACPFTVAAEHDLVAV